MNPVRSDRKLNKKGRLPSSAAAREAKMVAFKTAEKAQTGESDPILTRLANEDKVPWYRKRNLRLLYLLLFPACMGIELTSGFDSQLINALQLVPSWISCESVPRNSQLCWECIWIKLIDGYEYCR